MSIELVYRVARIMDRSRVSYAFVGGIAVATWGIPRTTFDMDLAISASDSSVLQLLSSVESEGFVVDAIYKSGYRDRLGPMEKIHFSLAVGATFLAVDLFLDSTPFISSVMSRRVEVDLGLGPFSIASAADVFLMKLLADRPKDRVDIDNIIAVQGIPERSYLEKWANELGVSERLRPYLDASR